MPEGTLAKQLASLLSTAETLNTTSNSINTILNAVEHELIKGNIGLEVWLSPTLSSSTPEATDNEGATYVEVELGFTKLHDGWHLAARTMDVQQGPLGHDGEPQWIQSSLHRGPYPLAQASRQERLKALGLLPILIERLHEEAEDAIKAIEEAKKLVIC